LLELPLQETPSFAWRTRCQPGESTLAAKATVALRRQCGHFMTPKRPKGYDRSLVNWRNHAKAPLASYVYDANAAEIRSQPGKTMTGIWSSQTHRTRTIPTRQPGRKTRRQCGTNLKNPAISIWRFL
jgi:hypothetical protein